MALDTLWATLRPPPDVALVCTRRQLHRWRHRPVRTEHCNWWRDWRVRPGMVADRGGVVCALDNIQINCSIATFARLEM